MKAWTEEVFSLPGQVLVVSRRRDLAAPGAAAASAGVDADHRQQGIDRVGRRRTTCRSRPGWLRAACAKTSSATTRNASREHGHRITPDHLSLGAVGLRRRQQGAGGDARTARITSISIARCSATATSPRPRCSAGPATLDEPATDFVRPENLPSAMRARADYRNMTMADVEREAEDCRGARRAEVTRPASSPTPSTPAPARCWSASTAARCRTRCSSNRSAASPTRCCRRCRRTR